MLDADAAIVAGLCVSLEPRTGHPDLRARADHGHPIGRTGQRLAIRAMADRDPLRIDLGLIAHASAAALSVDMHSENSKKKRRPKAPFLTHLACSVRRQAASGFIALGLHRQLGV